jgi:ferritin
MEQSSNGNMLKRTLATPVKSTAPTVAPGVKAPSIKGKNILLSDECVSYLNYRIEQEEYSSRIYLAMSMWLNNNGYTNAAALWKKYSNEELAHADWAREYLLAMGVQPMTPRLDAPIQEFSGLPQIIHDSYDHEIVVTKQVKDLATDAFKKGDHMLYELTLKYLKEQVEEHDKMQNWVDQLNAFGTDKVALRLLDNEMG